MRILPYRLDTRLDTPERRREQCLKTIYEAVERLQPGESITIERHEEDGVKPLFTITRRKWASRANL